MTRLIRHWPHLALAALCCGALVWTQPARSPQTPGRIWEFPLHPEGDSREELERKRRATVCRVMARNRIARDVISGRLTVLEAAERFRDLNEAAYDSNRNYFRQFVAGNSDDERCCRMVLSFVEGQLDTNSEPDRLLVAKIRLEVDGLASQGTIRLPR